LIDDVLELIEKFNFPINRPTRKILVAAPYIDGMENIDSEPPE
jgi:hypothetical protein